MALLPREVSGRRYFRGSGILFLVAGAVVGVVAIVAAPDLFGRAFGAGLAGLLFLRGILRLHRARTISSDAVVRETLSGRHVVDHVPTEPVARPGKRD